MLSKKLNRRKAVGTLFGLAVFATLAVGSGTQVVTVTKIVDQVSTVITILELVDRASDLTLASVDNSYQDLGSYLRENSFTTDVVVSMEEQYSELSSHFSELRSSLENAESEAANLFMLLRSRADENTNPDFKQTMLSRISEKEDSFNVEIGEANQVLSKVGQSVQQYNDILGLAQVMVGLDAVDTYIAQVNSVLEESDALNANISQAISEASEIIKSSAIIGDSSSIDSALDDQEFPQPACGDDNPPGLQDFYPVFVNPSNQETLDYVRQSYCGDALVKTRKDTNKKAIQVVSFRSREKALQFSDVLRSDSKLAEVEIGEPSQF